ncbi:MAG: phosphoribosylformylglycinamidine synthase subunit PurS [Candidatus Dormiibacterota bacterium]
MVSLKDVVNDPQGLVVEAALHSLGYPEVTGARVGKYIRLELAEADLESARGRVDEMCRRLLCNGVIEDYRFELRPVPSA